VGIAGNLKKDCYFIAGSVEASARELLTGLPDFGRARAAGFRPDRAALLLLDLQKYFLDPESHAYIPSAPAILDALLVLAGAFRRHRRPVIWTRHGNTPADVCRMADWWRDVLVPDSPAAGWIVPPEPEDIVVDKTGYDAFLGTDLASILEANGATQVVVCGVMTHLCCETTARSAFGRGFEVFFPADGTAAPTRAFHAASLLNLSHGFAVLGTIADLRAVLDAETPA